MWLCGLENLSEDQLEELKKDWSFLLFNPHEPRNLREENTFAPLIKLRNKILNECF
jgi:hypothetical protein